MSFVKLDCGILTSTLWVERSLRDVFITALLMARPMEITEPMEQYHVSKIEPTGFVVPIGWYGFVQAAGPGIIRMAMCGHDEGIAALEKLGFPDEESRSSDFEGRRLIRVDGGYIVLNYMKYRDKDTTGATRQARYRERQRMKVTSRRDETDVTRDSLQIVTKEEEEEEEEAYKIKNLTAPKKLLPTVITKLSRQTYNQAFLALYGVTPKWTPADNARFANAVKQIGSDEETASVVTHFLTMAAYGRQKNKMHSVTDLLRDVASIHADMRMAEIKTGKAIPPSPEMHAVVSKCEELLTDKPTTYQHPEPTLTLEQQWLSKKK